MTHLFHNFSSKKHKAIKFGTGVLYTKIPILSTVRAPSVRFIRKSCFKLFESLGVSANYLLKLKLAIVETKISTAKRLQFYP